MKAPFVRTPLTAIRNAVGSHVNVTYCSGGPTTVALGRLDDSGTVFLKPLPIRAGTGLTTQLANDDLSIEAAANVTNLVNTASEPATGSRVEPLECRLSSEVNGRVRGGRQTGRRHVVLHERSKDPQLLRSPRTHHDDRRGEVRRKGIATPSAAPGLPSRETDRRSSA